MFDWLRELTKSAETRRQERVTAYVDGQLSATEVAQFEAELQADTILQAEVEALRQLKIGLRALPRQRVPRNFTLNPAEYGKPAPAYDAQFYPVLRTATALAAIMFLLVVTLSLLNFGGSSEEAVGIASFAVDTMADEDSAAVADEEMADSGSEDQLAETTADDGVMVEQEVAVAETEVAAETTVVVEIEVVEEAEVMEEEASDEAMADDAMADAEAVPEPAADMVEAEIASDDSADDGELMEEDVADADTAFVEVEGDSAETALAEESLPESTQTADAAHRNSTTQTTDSASTIGATTTANSAPELQATEVATAPENGADTTNENVTEQRDAQSQQDTTTMIIVALAAVTLLLLALTLFLRYRIDNF